MIERLENDQLDDEDVVSKYIKDLDQMMTGMIDLNSKNTLPERERSLCFKLLLDLTTRDDFFSMDDRSQFQDWLVQIEGTRGRRRQQEVVVAPKKKRKPAAPAPPRRRKSVSAASGSDDDDDDGGGSDASEASDATDDQQHVRKEKKERKPRKSLGMGSRGGKVRPNMGVGRGNGRKINKFRILGLLDENGNPKEGAEEALKLAEARGEIPKSKFGPKRRRTNDDYDDDFVVNDDEEDAAVGSEWNERDTENNNDSSNVQDGKSDKDLRLDQIILQKSAGTAVESGNVDEVGNMEEDESITLSTTYMEI